MPYEHDPEFCRRVAEAVGSGYFKGDPLVDDMSFRPDVDWNDAMWAAEKMGLFHGDPDASLLAGTNVSWLVCWIGAEDPIERRVEHESGPRAICEAILKLKSETEKTQ